MSTLSDLQTEVSEEIGSINATEDATKINRFLNRGVRDFLLRSGVKVSSATMDLTADQNDYTLDDEVLDIKNVSLASGGSDYRFEQVSPQELLDMRRGETSSNSPAMHYALNGSDLFMVYPTPAAADTITIYYVKKPTEMSSAANDPSTATYGGIPVVFHDALALYAMWKLASFDDDQSSAQGQRYKDEYMERVRDARRNVATKGNARMPRARVGRRRLAPHDPSADVRW